MSNKNVSPEQRVRQPKLSRQLISLILLLYFGIATALTFMQLIAEFQIEQDRLESQIRATSNSFQPTITTGLWNYEEDSLNASLFGLYKNNIIYGAQIKDAHGAHWEIGYIKDDTQKIIVAENDYLSDSEQLKTLDLDNTYLKLYDNTFPIKKENDSNKLETIGHLTLYYSSVTLVERTWTTSWIQLISATIHTASGEG